MLPLEAVEPRRNNKRKMLAAAKDLQNSGGNKQGRLQVGDSNPEPGDSRSKHNKKETQSQRNGGIEAVMFKEQVKVRAVAKERDEMWGLIAKAVDTAMVAESPGKIQQKQVNYILKAILDCALPEGLVEKPSQKDTFTGDNAAPPLLKPVPV